MSRAFLAGVLVLALMSPALAQTASQPSTAAVVNIAPEQRAMILQFIVQAKVQPVMINQHVGIGTSLPDDVELLAAPSDWGPELTQYRYVVSHTHIFLVEPFGRRVVTIVN